MWGTVHFFVRWGGDHLNYFGMLQKGATPKKFYDEDGGSPYSSNPTGTLPPPPPTHPIKNERSLNDQSLG